MHVYECTTYELFYCSFWLYGSSWFIIFLVLLCERILVLCFTDDEWDRGKNTLEQLHEKGIKIYIQKPRSSIFVHFKVTVSVMKWDKTKWWWWLIISIFVIFIPSWEKGKLKIWDGVKVDGNGGVVCSANISRLNLLQQNYCSLS